MVRTEVPRTTQPVDCLSSRPPLNRREMIRICMIWFAHFYDVFATAQNMIGLRLSTEAIYG